MRETDVKHIAEMKHEILMMASAAGGWCSSLESFIFSSNSSSSKACMRVSTAETAENSNSSRSSKNNNNKNNLVMNFVNFRETSRSKHACLLLVSPLAVALSSAPPASVLLSADFNIKTQASN